MSHKNTDTLKGILVGCGFMGGMHAQIYAQLKDVDLVAAVDIHTNSSAEKLRSFNTPVPVYTSLTEALEHSDCDFVDICLPTHLHRDFALEAIHAGKALFCEKPLALSLAEAEEILEAAKAKGTAAQVGPLHSFLARISDPDGLPQPRRWRKAPELKPGSPVEVVLNTGSMIG